MASTGDGTVASTGPEHAAGQGAPGRHGGGGSGGSGPGLPGGLRSDPVPINADRIEPVYPALARQRQLAATVQLRLHIDSRGRVRDARPLRRAGHGFDEAALVFVRRLKFRPARAGNQAVPADIVWTVQFRGVR